MVGAAALAVAAGLHLAAFPGHREEGIATAAFFLLVAVAQLAAAYLLRRGAGLRARLAIAAGNLGLVVLWAVSRSVGVPGGGHGASPEPVALLDLLAVAAELTVVVGLLARPSSGAVRTRFAGSALVMTTVLVAGAALAWVPSGHAHPSHTSRTVSTSEPLFPHAHHDHP